MGKIYFQGLPTSEKTCSFDGLVTYVGRRIHPEGKPCSEENGGSRRVKEGQGEQRLGSTLNGRKNTFNRIGVPCPPPGYVFIRQSGVLHHEASEHPS